MSNIIRLRGSPHDQMQSLLPWYANGTLAPDEVLMVEAHLVDCSQCQADLEFEQVLAKEVASLPFDTERGWVACEAMLDAEAPATRFREHRSFFRRKIAIGWAVAGQLAAAGLIMLIYTGQDGQAPQPDQQIYHTLGSPPTNLSGNIVLLFKPNTSEREIRAALLGVDARVIDGPSVSGAYVVHVRQADRERALEMLRRSEHMLLAEPIASETES